MAPPLPRPVKLLGWTSLFTDAATEAIYPLLPIFVTRVLGGNAMTLGLIEGAADAVSSLLKLVAGRWSDRAGRRKPFVLAGYTIAWLARPLIALATTWQHVFVVRLSDRVGKGLRGAPRDAMLGALAPPGQRGRIFGYHRAMDHSGAVIGPLIATGFLWFFPGQYRTLFALTFIPGALAVAMLMLVPDVAGSGAGSAGGAGEADAARGAGKTGDVAPLPPDQPHPPHQPYLPHRSYPPQLTRFLVILTVFTLGNSTDAFLLLHLSNAGLPTVYLPLAWSALHVVKAGLSTMGGALSDRFGRVRLIVSGWIVYAAVYAGFAFSESLVPLMLWFMAYGVHFALVEGSEKALVSDLAPPALQGTAFGWYNAVLGIGALGASIGFGAMWEGFGPQTAFLSGAGLALAAAIALIQNEELRTKNSS